MLLINFITSRVIPALPSPPAPLCLPTDTAPAPSPLTATLTADWLKLDLGLAYQITPNNHAAGHLSQPEVRFLAFVLISNRIELEWDKASWVGGGGHGGREEGVRYKSFYCQSLSVLILC